MQMFTEGITEFSYKINYLLISSFKALPGLNLGVLEAAMVMVSPVLGFLPSRAGLSLTSKLPNPTN